MFIWGVPDLSAADTIRVAFGNASLKATVKIVDKCIEMQTPAFLENPATSMLFDAPPIRRLRAKAQVVISDYCQYGEPWRKRTKVLVWNADASQGPTLTCHGRNKLCSRTGNIHTILKGLHPTLHIPWTKVAEPYPKAWCESWANVINNAVVNSGLHKLTLLCCK
jgi:hypothetical protein